MSVKNFSGVAKTAHLDPCFGEPVLNIPVCFGFGKRLKGFHRSVANQKNRHDARGNGFTVKKDRT